jgi:hypothetical protein
MSILVRKFGIGHGHSFRHLFTQIWNHNYARMNYDTADVRQLLRLVLPALH